MPARARAQLERTPGEYHDYQRGERRQTLRALLAELDRAHDRNDPWYLWVSWREQGIHRHDLRDEQGRAVACPVGGCDAVRGASTPHLPPARAARPRS